MRTPPEQSSPTAAAAAPPRATAERLRGLRAAGVSTLLEPDALALAAGLGIRVPGHIVLTGRQPELPDLTPRAGSEVVVKVVAPGLLHKTDVGGVEIVPRRPAAVGAAIAEISARLSRLEVTGYLLCERVGYDPTLGARPLRRAIQRLVEDPLSERLLYKEFRAGEIIIVDVEDDPEHEGEQMIVFRAIEGFEPPPVEELEESDIAQV